MSASSDCFMPTPQRHSFIETDSSFNPGGYHNAFPQIKHRGIQCLDTLLVEFIAVLRSLCVGATCGRRCFTHAPFDYGAGSSVLGTHVVHKIRPAQVSDRHLKGGKVAFGGVGPIPFIRPWFNWFQGLGSISKAAKPWHRATYGGIRFWRIVRIVKTHVVCHRMQLCNATHIYKLDDFV